MKRQPHPPFSMLELLKMVRRLDDAISKIQRVADKLALDANAKEIILLTQAVQNLIKVRDRLAAEAEKSLEILAKTRG